MKAIISKDMVKQGYTQSIIKLTTEDRFNHYEHIQKVIDETDEDIGVVCAIGNYWFYFGEEEADYCTVKEFKNKYSDNDIIDILFNALEIMRNDPEQYELEYGYYYCYLSVQLER